MRLLIAVVFAGALFGAASCSKDSSGGAAGGGATVKECDDWLAKMQACEPKLDPSKRAEFESGLKATQEGFAAQAGNDKSKAGLQTNCQLLLTTPMSSRDSPQS